LIKRLSPVLFSLVSATVFLLLLVLIAGSFAADWLTTRIPQENFVDRDYDELVGTAVFWVQALLVLAGGTAILASMAWLAITGLGHPKGPNEVSRARGLWMGLCLGAVFVTLAAALAAGTMVEYEQLVLYRFLAPVWTAVVLIVSLLLTAALFWLFSVPFTRPVFAGEPPGGAPLRAFLSNTLKSPAKRRAGA